MSTPRTRPGIGSAGHGFTLVELMVVVAIVAVVAMIAAPNFSSTMVSMSTRAAAYDLVSDLALARSEAVKRNMGISVAPVDEDWAKGWEVSAGTERLATRGAVSSALTIDAPEEGITFLPSGRVSGTMANMTWSIAGSGGSAGRCVVITPTGSARAKQGAC